MQTAIVNMQGESFEIEIKGSQRDFENNIRNAIQHGVFFEATFKDERYLFNVKNINAVVYGANTFIQADRNNLVREVKIDTPEEIEAKQKAMQPLAVIFEEKRKAMEEMSRAENDAKMKVYGNITQNLANPAEIEAEQAIVKKRYKATYIPKKRAVK